MKVVESLWKPLERKRKIIPFQNTKNYWNPISINEVTFDWKFAISSHFSSHFHCKSWKSLKRKNWLFLLWDLANFNWTVLGAQEELWAQIWTDFLCFPLFFSRKNGNLTWIFTILVFFLILQWFVRSPSCPKIKLADFEKIRWFSNDFSGLRLSNVSKSFLRLSQSFPLFW